MVKGLILIGMFLLCISWSVLAEKRLRLKGKLLLGKDYPPELQKTTAFGSFMFCVAAGAFTAGLIIMIYALAKDVFSWRIFYLLGLICFLPSFVFWYVGFRHDRPKLKRFYHNQDRTKNATYS